MLRGDLIDWFRNTFSSRNLVCVPKTIVRSGKLPTAMDVYLTYLLKWALEDPSYPCSFSHTVGSWHCQLQREWVSECPRTTGMAQVPLPCNLSMTRISGTQLIPHSFVPVRRMLFPPGCHSRGASYITHRVPCSEHLSREARPTLGPQGPVNVHRPVTLFGQWSRWVEVYCIADERLNCCPVRSPLTPTDADSRVPALRDLSRVFG